MRSSTRIQRAKEHSRELVKQTDATLKAELSDAYRKQELREESCLRITRQSALWRSNLPNVEGHDRSDPVGEGNQHWRKPAYSKLVC